MISWFIGPDLLRAFVLVALGIIVFQLARHRPMQRAILWSVVGVLAVGLLYSFATEWWPQWISWQTAARAGGFRWGATNITGVVRSFNYGPAGEIDGLILDSGVIAHFPPERSGQIASIAPVGALVRAWGWTHFGPAGDRILDAETITNGYTGASVNIQGSSPPALAPSALSEQRRPRPAQ